MSPETWYIAVGPNPYTVKEKQSYMIIDGYFNSSQIQRNAMYSWSACFYCPGFFRNSWTSISSASSFSNADASTTCAASQLSSWTRVFKPVISDFEMPTKYILKNIWGQSVYFAAEENDCCTLNCYPRSLRPFTIKIFNNLGQEVIELRRPCRCWCGCCCGCTCSLQELEVHAPPGTPIGYIKETCHPGRPKFSVQDEAKEEIFKIAGHSLKCMCTEDFRFEVMSKDEQESVGRISKQWAGITGDTRETFTDADLFGIEFPMDFDVKMKAVMIGAGFLINYMYFGEDPIVITETHVI
ncbi:phospholipid scramblase 1-like isoform X1 [Hemicordylus capensis]|uniref:phospholipid scramblase 1-like isoform X1 n=1 Tax=Hemicordylus capensis TaxID=884348 RepID=UPI0023027FE1|nr:phospholipid scramblase 1-like isoform X1 [Hemicordylus capensis]